MTQGYTEWWELQSGSFRFAHEYADIKVVFGATALSTRKSLCLGVVEGCSQNVPSVFFPYLLEVSRKQNELKADLF